MDNENIRNTCRAFPCSQGADMYSKVADMCPQLADVYPKAWDRDYL